MKTPAHTYFTAGLALLALAVCHSVQQVSAADPNGRITTEQEFREVLVGKKTSNKQGYSVLHEDGSMSGDFGRKELTGTWTWEGEYLCRGGKLGKNKLPRDCLAVIVSGDKMTVIAKKGKGKKRKYKIQETAE